MLFTIMTWAFLGLPPNLVYSSNVSYLPDNNCKVGHFSDTLYYQYKYVHCEISHL